MNYVPLIVLLAVIVVLLTLAARTRRRQATAQLELAERIGVGTDVMTTSGLHATVVGKHDDGTVTLSIAPGVEVRWELAALRDAASLPDRAVGGPTTTVDHAAPERPADLTKDDPAAGETR